MKIATFLMILALALSLSIPLQAKTDSKELTKAEKHSSEAAEVFKDVMKAPDKGIPNSIMDSAEVIAVFPSVLKVGFIIGGSGGAGVASIRDPETHQWQDPIFVNIGGGSFGAQIGAQSIDLILVGMNRHAADVFIKDRFKLGGELSVSAGPVGRNAEASTDLPSIKSEFLSYSRSRGLFAGITITGSVIKQDKALNQAAYGMPKIESMKTVSHRTSSRVSVFPQTLATYTTKYRAA